MSKESRIVLEDGVIKLTQAVAYAMETAPVLGCFYTKLKLSQSRFTEWSPFMTALRTALIKWDSEKWGGTLNHPSAFKYFVVKEKGKRKHPTYCFYLFFNAEALANQSHLNDEHIARNIEHVICTTLTKHKHTPVTLTQLPHYFSFPRYTDAMPKGLCQLMVHAQPVLRENKFTSPAPGEYRILQSKERRFFSRATTEQCLHWATHLLLVTPPYYDDGKLHIQYRKKRRCPRLHAHILNELYANVEAEILFTHHQSIIPKTLMLE